MIFVAFFGNCKLQVRGLLLEPLRFSSLQPGTATGTMEVWSASSVICNSYAFRKLMLHCHSRNLDPTCYRSYLDWLQTEPSSVLFSWSVWAPLIPDPIWNNLRPSFLFYDWTSWRSNLTIFVVDRRRPLFISGNGRRHRLEKKVKILISKLVETPFLPQILWGSFPRNG